jgi:hypothetical protein
VLAGHVGLTPTERAAIRQKLGSHSLAFSDRRLAQALLTFNQST